MKQFAERPFDTLNTLDLKFHGFQLNILRDDAKLRKAILEIFCLPPLAAWVLLGADSTADQVAYFLLNTPRFLLGHITLHQWIDIYHRYYGLGTHWSAAVIYSLLLIGISKHLREKHHIKNSENLCLTTGYVAITIAAFEWFWQLSYYVFQHQHWILSFQWPQARILLQNTGFLVVGLIGVVGMYIDKEWHFRRNPHFRLNLEWKTWVLLTLTIGIILFWFYYPFPTQRLEVYITGGGWTGDGITWVSSPRFPQTMYTIDVNLTDNLPLGQMYHIDDPGVHLTNNLAKICMTLTFYSLFKLKERTPS